MWPKLPTIALSMHDEDIYAQRCLRAGARGYVMKNEGPEKLAAAIRHVLAGGTYVSAETASRIVDLFTGHKDRETSAPIARLSDREFDVFQLIGRGLSTQEIADRLHLSVKTVETHRMHIKTKVRIGTTAELTAYAARWVAATG